jgi:hypothetical protein
MKNGQSRETVNTEQIRHGQSRETVNTGHIRHGQSRETVNTGHIRHRMKTNNNKNTTHKTKKMNNMDPVRLYLRLFVGVFMSYCLICV